MIDDSLIQRIAAHEGFKAFPSPDAKGMYSVGFGHDLTPQQAAIFPVPISSEDAYALLEQDVQHASDEANQAFPWLIGLNDARQGCVVEMVFQLGLLGVQAFTHMITAIRDQNWQAAHDAMLDSEWHNQTPARCEELATIMLNGADNTAIIA